MICLYSGSSFGFVVAVVVVPLPDDDASYSTTPNIEAACCVVTLRSRGRALNGTPPRPRTLLLSAVATGIALQGLPSTPATREAAGAGGGEATAPAGIIGADFCPSAAEADVVQRAYGKGSPIHKYLDLALSDFDEAFALLPQDANILDPQLMGPNFMNERVRLRVPPGVVPGGAGERGWGGGQEVLDEVLAMAMQVIGRQDAAARMRRQGGGGGRGGAEGNLSPSSPLAQLFWQTLLPWNVFPTPLRPTPPPPRWL